MTATAVVFLGTYFVGHIDWPWQLAAFWLFLVAGFLPLSRLASSPAFYNRCVGPASPQSLALIRIVAAGYLLTSALWEDVASTAMLPRGLIRPLGTIGVLRELPIGFDRLLVNHTALWWFQAAVIVLLVCAAAGLWSRFTLLAGSLSYILLAGILRQYLWFFHSGLIPALVCLQLSFLPCHHAWSVDRLLRRREGQPVVEAAAVSSRYGWCRYQVWTLIALTYGFAGLSKLYYSGLAWCSAEPMKGTLLRTGLAPKYFPPPDLTVDLLAGPDWLFLVLSVFGLFGEVLFPLVLFSRRARGILPLMMGAMHISIFLLQNIIFLDLILLQLVYYDLPQRLRGPAGETDAPHTAVAWQPAAQFRRPAMATLLLTCGMFSWWITHIEFYPLTTMKMMSTLSSTMHGDGQVRYIRATVFYEDGRAVRPPFHKWCPAITGRQRKILRRAFKSEKHRRVLREFLARCVREANRSAGPGERVIGFRVDRKVWNYRTSPTDPGRGQVERSVRYVVASQGAADFSVVEVPHNTNVAHGRGRMEAASHRR